MNTPYLTIDLDKIEHNANTIVDLCEANGIQVSGVTKCVCGDPAVAAAMLRGGVFSIADSRLQNLRRLQSAGIHQANMLIRLPALSKVDAVVESVDVSLNSELAVLKALAAAATRRGTIHQVMLMVDLGDLREGVMPDAIVPLAKTASHLSGIRIVGLASNLACFAGVVPTAENMQRFADLAAEVEQASDHPLNWISGANSSALNLIAAGEMPAGINHARIGEAILLGCETIERRPWPETFQDAFVLHAEVLELQTKPSLPIGTRGQDAYGGHPDFEDRGLMQRALLNVGREDVAIEGVVALDEDLRIVGASSGYLVVDVSHAARKLRVGDEVGFSLNYAALLAAMTSEYVQRRLLRDGAVTAFDA